MRQKTMVMGPAGIGTKNDCDSQSYITTDSQSASPSWCQAPIWDQRSIFLSPWNFVRHLRVWYFVAPTLMRGRVCNLLLLLVLASAVPLGSESHGTIFYCPNSWDSPNLEGQVTVFISPRNRVAQIYPRALGSLSVVSYDSQGYGGGILIRLHMGMTDSEGKQQFIRPDSPIVSQSCIAILWPAQLTHSKEDSILKGRLFSSGWLWWGRLPVS
jgi:hypothetical protein